MAFAGEQAGRRVEAYPARARKIHLRPGMQIGEVLAWPFRTIERLHIGLELDQVSGNEARRQPQVAQSLHQQPGGIPARSARQRQRILAGLDAGLHPDHISHHPLDALVERDQEIERTPRGEIDAVEKRPQPRPGGFGRHVGRQLLAL